MCVCGYVYGYVCVCVMCYVYTLHQPSASPAGMIPSGSTGFTGFSGESASSWALSTIAWHISATEPSPPTHTTLKNRYKIVTYHIMSVSTYFILPTRLNSFVSTTSSRGGNFSTGPILKVSITNKSFLIVAATNCMYQNSKTLIQYLDEYSDRHKLKYTCIDSIIIKSTCISSRKGYHYNTSMSVQKVQYYVNKRKNVIP